MSELIASLPIVEKVEKTEIVNSVLHHARFFRPLGDIAAVLILGAKNLTEERIIVQEKRHLFGLIKRKKETKIKIDKRAELAKAILENVRPTVLFNVVVQRLQDMEISSFFAITTSPKRGEYSQTDKGSGERLNDSIWATVLGIARTLGVTEKYALYDISYVNAIMYSRAMPMPGDKAENDNTPLYDGSKDANDPREFQGFYR